MYGCAASSGNPDILFFSFLLERVSTKDRSRIFLGVLVSSKLRSPNRKGSSSRAQREWDIKMHNIIQKINRHAVKTGEGIYTPTSITRSQKCPYLPVIFGGYLMLMVISRYY